MMKSIALYDLKVNLKTLFLKQYRFISKQDNLHCSIRVNVYVRQINGYILMTHQVTGKSLEMHQQFRLIQLFTLKQAYIYIFFLFLRAYRLYPVMIMT